MPAFFLVHMNQNALWFQSSTSKKKMGRFGTFFKVGHSTKVHQVYKCYLIFGVDTFNLSSWGLGTNLLEFVSDCCQCMRIKPLVAYLKVDIL